MFFGFGVIQFPLWALWTLDYKKPLWTSVKESLRPKESWGPKSKKNRESWRLYKEDIKERREAYEKEHLANPVKRFLNVIFGKYVS